MSGDTDTYGLAVIFNQFRDAEQRAVSDIYKKVMRELDAKDRQVAEALVESRIASTVKVVVDFAALSLEEPDYVLRHLESFRRAYSDRPGRGGPAVPNSPGDVLGDDDVIEVFFE